MAGPAAWTPPTRAYGISEDDARKLPLGLRHSNNVFNVKYYRGAERNQAKWPGLIGPSIAKDQGDPQMLFATPEDSAVAGAGLLQRKYASGMRTPRQLIAGKSGWTPGYVGAADNVAKIAGVAPNGDARLDTPEGVRRFMPALAEQEHGPVSRRLLSTDFWDKAAERATGAQFASGALPRLSLIDRSTGSNAHRWGTAGQAVAASPAAAPPPAPTPTAAAGQSSMIPAATSPTAMISPEMEAILQRYRSKASPTGRDFSSVGKAIGSLGGMIYDSAQTSEAERRMVTRETDQRSKMDQMFTGAPSMSPAATAPAQAKAPPVAPVAPAAAPPSKIEATEPPRFLSPSTPEAVGIAGARVDGYNTGSAGGSPMSNFPVAPSAPAGWNGPASVSPSAASAMPSAPTAPPVAPVAAGGMTPEEIRQARVLASMGDRAGAMKIMETARARSTPEYAIKQRLAQAELQIAERKAAGNLTPMEQVQLETAQAELAAKRKALEAPSAKIMTAKSDETVLSVDPRTGEKKIIQQPTGDASGYKTIKDKAGVEAELRKEFASNAKPYFETRDAFTRIQESARTPSPASDISLIFNYMKMLDPGSVVREGEFATAQNAAGVDQRVMALYNRVISGQRLTPEIRKDFVTQATGLHDRARAQYERIQSQYRGVAERSGVDPRNTIIDYGQPGAAPAASSAAVKPASDPIPVTTPEEAMRLPKGTAIRLPDGSVGVVP